MLRETLAPGFPEGKRNFLVFLRERPDPGFPKKKEILFSGGIDQILIFPGKNGISAFTEGWLLPEFQRGRGKILIFLKERPDPGFLKGKGEL